VTGITSYPQFTLLGYSILSLTKIANQENFVQLKNHHDRVFYDKLTFIYLTLPNFKLSLKELKTNQDKWFYIFRHLQELQEIPPELQGDIFLKLFETAQIACFNPVDRTAYEDSLKNYRDWKGITETAHEEGREEGRKEGREEIARNLLDILDNATITQKTGLSEAQVELLRHIANK
jgi:predicted transposase/invertase (TIGR01784 family)